MRVGQSGVRGRDGRGGRGVSQSITLLHTPARPLHTHPHPFTPLHTPWSWLQGYERYLSDLLARSSDSLQLLRGEAASMQHPGAVEVIGELQNELGMLQQVRGGKGAG